MGGVESLMVSPDKKKSFLGKWLKQIIGIVISVVCLWLVFRDTNFEELKQTILKLNWFYVLLGIASLGVDYAIRIKRWAVMLQATGAKVTTLDCAPAFLGSIALNNVYPLRAGDVVRALVFPKAIGVDRVTSTASLVLERLLDLLTLLICFGIGLSFSSITKIPDWLGESVLTLSVIGGAFLFFIVVFSRLIVMWLTALKNYLSAKQYARLANIVAVISDMLSHLKTMAHPRVLLSLFALSMLIWVGEAGLFWALLKGLSIDISPIGAIVIMAIATISTLAPSSPGYAGTFDLAVKLAVGLLGGTDAQGAGFAIIVHYIGIWLPTTLAGAVALMYAPSLFKQNKAD